MPLKMLFSQDYIIIKININEKQFDLACAQAIKDVIDEDDRFIKEINCFLEYEDN